MAGEADALVLLCAAFIFPPAAVALVAGCGFDLCLNILLTLIGFLPGCIHAFWLVLKRTEANERYGYGNWIYVGMGEYHPRTPRPSSGQATASYNSSQAPPPPPPPPAAAQPQTAATPPPPPPSDQHPAGKPPGLDQPQAPADQKSGGQTAEPPAPAYTESSGDVPPAEPSKQ